MPEPLLADPSEPAGMAPPVERPRYWLHALLFVLTCYTTFRAGGPWFAATLMAILTTHEMGHFIAAKIHGVDASLPFFIPLPPFLGTGTLGAIIRMRAPIERRDALVDVGASGPIAGLCVAIPLLVVGLVQSKVGPALVAGHDGQWIEGDSILYILLKIIAKGRYLPAGGLDVNLGPVANAAWVGILITFINLMPIGQLDGGHVAYAFFGERHEKQAGWLHRTLVVVGFGVIGVLAWMAHVAGRSPGASLIYGAAGAIPWFIWTGLLFVLRRASGGRYHPPTGAEPLSPSRRAICILVAVIFVLLFTPVPMREPL